jgi:hypothetical protein
MPPRAKLKAPAPAAPASGATLEHLPEILRALLSAENESRGVAEATLKALVRDARGQCIAALLRHARGDADASVRQLAAVVLKRKVLAHWSTLPPAHQEEFKNALLEGVVREPVPAVRRAIADVVSKVAKATVPMGAWSALPEFLAQCAQSPEEGHREVAFVLFASLTETIVGTMTRHYATLGNLFQSGLADASLRVRVAALRAALALATNAPEKGSKDETEILRGLVLPVLAVARNAIAAGEEKDASLAFEVLDELVEAQPKALAGRIEEVVAFCVEVAGARDLDAVTRRRALDAVSFLARHKPKALCRAKVVPPLLRALCPLCGEPKESELAGDADVDDEDEAHVQTVAARLVDLLALNAPAKHVLPEVLAFASHAVSDANDDPRLRHAGVAVLGIVAEGCAEGLERAMPQIVPPVVAALRDGSRDVRGAAAFALGQFAECVADATDFHAAVLPAAFAALTVETDARCLERTVYVLDAWLERLEEGDVAPYVKPTLDIAYAAIDGAWAFKTREAVLGAVASAAAAAGTAMHAHLPALLPRLEKCLTASGDDDLRSRARALEVLGMLISASGGAEAMAPHVPAAMAAAAAGFDEELDYSELREYGHGLFAETAEALGERFAPYLPACLEKARATLELDDGVVYDSEDERDEARRGGDGDDSDASDESDESGFGAGINYSVFSGVVEEKAAACRAVASYAHSCPEAFAPFVAAFAPTLSAMADHMHDVVRAQAHAALARLAQCALRAAPLPGTAHLSHLASVPDASPAFDVVDASLNAAHRALSEDDDRDAVCAAMEAAAEVIKSVARRDGTDLDAAGAADVGAAGPGAARLHAGKHVEGLAALCLRVLEGRAVCQEDADDDVDFRSDPGLRDSGETPSDEDEDEEAELGVVVLEGCAELLPALVAVAGANAAAAFEPHFAALARRVGPSRPEGQRSVAYATLVEMVKALGAAPAVARVAPAALAGCVGEMAGAHTAGLRRNCAYCAGVLAELGGEAVAGQREALVAALCRLLAREGGDGMWAEEDAGTRDNAAGAAARTLFAANGAVARDARLGPPLMDALLAGVPLREDFEECASVYERGLAKLADLAAEVPAATERLGGVVAAAARVAGEAARNTLRGAPKDSTEKTGPTRETLAVVAASVTRLHAMDAAAVDAAVAGLPEDQRTALASLVAGF